MCPPSPCSSIRGRNVWMPLTTPPSSTPRPQSQSSYLASVTGPRMPMPALLQRTCTLPKTRSASSAARAKASRSVTSSSIACTLSRRPPSSKPLRASVYVFSSQVGDHDVHPRRDECRRHAEPDAARAAGDKRCLAIDSSTRAFSRPATRRGRSPLRRAGPPRLQADRGAPARRGTQRASRRRSPAARLDGRGA